MRAAWVVLFAGAMISGCHRAAPGSPADPAAKLEAAANVQVAPGAGRRAEDPARAHQRIDVPAGRFEAGSLPGDEGRDPTLEPVLASYELPGFAVDALPYPNEPGVPPLTGVSAGEAARLCAARDERLCTELEWERACRGPNGDAFSSGPGWDPTCAEASASCVSGFGVRAMGGVLEEWTASAVAAPHDATGGSVDAAKTKGSRTAVKGAWSSAPPAAHRCAARRALDPHAKPAMLGFRCCAGGDPDGAKLAAIESAPAPFGKATLPPSRLPDVLGRFPELARIKSGPRFFRETEVAPVFEAGKHPAEGTVVTVEPILWSPAPGEQILVATGKSRVGAWVVALHVLPEQRFRLASSMIFANEQGPIVLAYQPGLKKEIAWSTCWGCAGEGGAVTYRDDHRVVIVQR